MPTYTGTTGKTYQTPGKAFAGGGEGDIYDVMGDASLVAKIYNQDKRTTGQERKLAAMVELKPDVLEQYAWPIDVLYENSDFMGFVMPKVNGKEKLRNIYVYDKRFGKPWPLFVNIAKNLAAAIHNVHQLGQVIGDLNPENILVDPNNGMVSLVDTDSYHITDAQLNVHRCGVGMPEFVAPELQGKHFPSEPLPTFTKESDKFSLSVLIFALFMNGAHPFACKTLSGSSTSFMPVDNMVNGRCAYFPDSSSPDIEIPIYSPEITSLPHEMQKLFHRAFVDGRRNTKERPSAEEWYYALESLEKNMKRCTLDGSHQYYINAPQCPWCEVERKMKALGAMPETPRYDPVSPESNSSVFSSYSSSSSTSPQQQPTSQTNHTGWLVAAIFAVAIIVFIAIPKGPSGNSSTSSSNSYSSNSQSSPVPTPVSTQYRVTMDSNRLLYKNGKWETLGLRTGPSSNYNDIERLNRGDIVTLIERGSYDWDNEGRGGDWIKVRVNKNGNVGWCFSAYLDEL